MLMLNKKLNILLLFITLCSPFTLSAKNINDLVEQNKLSIAIQINHKEHQIVGQALILSIEVATQRWFAKGSQVRNFTMADVVMQANNIITINGSKRINGQTWATQNHEITLYPTLSGNYQVPAIKVDVSANTENNGIVSGVLSTKETSFDIALPEELIGIDSFIVSPQVSLNIDGQFDEAKEYAVGEAVTQTITITASDTPAMMLPELNVANSTNTTLEGISIYHKPAQVFDKSNRGSLSGSRVESFTYIFEKSGSYTLPEQVIFWWNSQSNALEKLIIPSSSWTVSGESLAQVKEINTSIGKIKFNLNSVLMLMFIIAFTALASALFIKRNTMANYYKKITKYEQRQLRHKFYHSITKQNYIIATQQLYKYALKVNKQAEIQNWRLTQELNQIAFEAKANVHSFSLSDAKVLIKQIDAETNKRVKHDNFNRNKAINLNSE